MTEAKLLQSTGTYVEAYGTAELFVAFVGFFPDTVAGVYKLTFTFYYNNQCIIIILNHDSNAHVYE